jgi:NDP-sugar pyrophosphorylase family protein
MTEDFVCVNGDITVTADTLKKLLDAHKEHRGNIMTLVEVPDPREFGVVTMGPGNLVQSIEEKPGRPSARIQADCQARRRGLEATTSKPSQRSFAATRRICSRPAGDRSRSLLPW